MKVEDGGNFMHGGRFICLSGKRTVCVVVKQHRSCGSEHLTGINQGFLYDHKVVVLVITLFGLVSCKHKQMKLITKIFICKSNNCFMSSIFISVVLLSFRSVLNCDFFYDFKTVHFCGFKNHSDQRLRVRARHTTIQ